MTKLLSVMLPQCLEWKVSISCICQPMCASGYVSFRSFLWLCHFPFSTKMFVWEKDGKFFFQFLEPTNSHGRHKYSRFFWFPEEYSTRHSQLFREKCAWEALILFGGNKQLITLPITQKRMLCGYQVILSLELMSWEFFETSQKDLFLCSSDGMKHRKNVLVNGQW